MKLTILILEDEPEVRVALERDLMEFADTVRIEPAQDVADAWEVIDDIAADGDVLALALCDHRLPGTTGVDFLVEMMDDERTASTRKVLVTGQADLKDTVRAVNKAQLDHYIAKPWDADELRNTVRECLTDYVEQIGVNPLPFMPALEADRAMDLMRNRSVGDW
ncbi:MAG: response regulator [Trueperella sp.]|nr:response regulator [Trueperella sp.]